MATNEKEDLQNYWEEKLRKTVYSWQKARKDGKAKEARELMETMRQLTAALADSYGNEAA